MGKRNSAGKGDDEGLIYKNSNNTFNTYSKMFSSASKIFTKSLIMELRKNISNCNFYESNGKLKRDLSIETDICKIVRFCRKNLRRPTNRLEMSETKCIINNTQTNTVNDFQPNGSGCGDSIPNCIRKGKHFNIDLSDVVMNNLKELLNVWIKNYLLEHNKTKQKIETVLDSILHKLESQATKSSSTCTYTLDIKIVDQKESSNVSELKNQKHSRGSHYTIPLRGRHLKIISTLSIPRNINKVNKKSLYRINKLSKKYIYVSMKRNNKPGLTASSINILSVSTHTLTKNCATYENNDFETRLDEKWTTYIPKPSNSTLYTNEINNDIKQTLEFSKDITIKGLMSPLKSALIGPIKGNSRNPSIEQIDCDEKQNISQPYMNFIADNKRSKQNRKKLVSKMEFRRESIDFLDLIIDEINKRNEMNEAKMNISGNNRISKKISKRHKSYKKGSKYSYFFKNLNMRNLKKSKMPKKHQILKRFQTIFQYFANSCGTSDLKFDIHVNVCSAGKNFEEEEKTLSPPKKSSSVLIEKNCNDSFTIRQNLKNNVTVQSPITSINSKLIPLLDGAASHTKYLISRETSTNQYDQIIASEYNDKIKANKIDFTHEICDLREIVKDLKDTAEKIIKIHFSDKTSKKITDPTTKIKPNARNSKLRYNSRGNQISNISPKSNITSGLKLQKSPRRKTPKDFNPRLVKKSTSYHIIDSETILKVTDMTSAAATVNTNKVADEALTCSFPKSKSLFEVSISSNKHKLIAFYCDDFVKPRYAFNENECSMCPCILRSSETNQGFSVKPSCSNNCCVGSSYPKSTTPPKLTACSDICTIQGNYGRSSSILIDDCEKGSAKKFTLRNHQVGRWEGCCYCVILWIPILVILCLIYKYVLQDELNKITKSGENLKIVQRLRFNSPNNKSQFPFRLTDIGF